MKQSFRHLYAAAVCLPGFLKSFRSLFAGWLFCPDVNIALVFVEATVPGWV
jgi:hypothetical protein